MSLISAELCRALDFHRAGISSTTLYQCKALQNKFLTVEVYKTQTIVTYSHICKDKIFLVAKNSVLLLCWKVTMKH